MKLRIFFILLFIYSAPVFSECLHSEIAESKFQASEDRQLIASVCQLTEEAGYVTIDVIQNHVSSQKFQIPFESSAYVLDVDNFFDIDLDGIPDLVVGTGKGRGGEGRHYWLFDKATKLYLDLGEFPVLSHDKKGNKSDLISLISSTGQYQSVRYNYQFTHGKITLLSAIGFIPYKKNSENYYIVHLKLNSQNEFVKHGKKILMNSIATKKCMDGTGICGK